MLIIFLFDNFFEKSSIFRENREKLLWEHVWQFFRKCRRPAQKIDITSFYNKLGTPNILLFNSFFKKNKKNIVFQFWGKGCRTTKMNIGNLFCGNEYRILFSSFFLKKTHTAWMKAGKSVLGHIFLYIRGSIRLIVSKNDWVHPWMDPHQQWEFHEKRFITAICMVRSYTYL